jgi:hypothetical protein
MNGDVHNLREKGLVVSHSLRVHSHHGGEGMAVGV